MNDLALEELPGPPELPREFRCKLQSRHEEESVFVYMGLMNDSYACFVVLGPPWRTAFLIGLAQQMEDATFHGFAYKCGLLVGSILTGNPLTREGIAAAVEAAEKSLGVKAIPVYAKARAEA